MTDTAMGRTPRGKSGWLRFGQVVLGLVTVALLGAHLFKWEAVRVDGTALALLGMLIVIPIVDLVRKVKLGDFEAEIGRDEVAKARASASIEISPVPQTTFDDASERVRELLREDPRLALAKVRIELEAALRDLYSATGGAEVDPRRTSLGRLIEWLLRREALSASMASALRDVVSLANRAVHGEHVDADTAEQLALLGVRLEEEVRHLTQMTLLRPVEQRTITRDDVNRYLRTRYKVTTVLPAVDNPSENTYILDQEGLEFFLTGYETYAEFLVKVEEV